MKVIACVTARGLQVAGIGGVNGDATNDTFSFHVVSVNITDDLIKSLSELIPLCTEEKSYNLAKLINIENGPVLLQVYKHNHNYISVTLNNVRPLFSGSAYKATKILKAIKKAKLKFENDCNKEA